MLVHSRKIDPHKQKEIKKQVKLFSIILAYCQDITKLFRAFAQYGKDKEIELSLEIDEATVKHLLEERLLKIQSDLENWKSQLIELRRRHYFLTFVPNKLVFELVGVSADSENYQRHNSIVKKLKELRLLKQTLPDLTKMPGELIDKLDRLCSDFMVEQVTAMRTELSQHISVKQIQH